MRRRDFLKSLGWSASALTFGPCLGYPSQRFKTTEVPSSEHFDVVRVSESVFAIRGKPFSGIPTTTSVIVGDKGVAVVDTHQRPSFDEEVINIVRQITDLPIRYLINTHWHQDHTLGNQVYEGRAKIVGHINTLRDLKQRVVSNLDLQRAVLPDQLEQARFTLADARSLGEPPSEQLEKLALQIELDSAYLKELQEIYVVLPEEVFERTYSLNISRQPIELLHVGAGHTQGDVVVFLPEEKTLIFGDLLTQGQPFMRPRDAVPSEWGPTLSKLRDLDWDHAVPGHGWVDHPRERIDILISYLGDLNERVRAAIAADVAAEEITRAVRLDEYAPYFPYFKYSVGENIRRTFEELSLR